MDNSESKYFDLLKKKIVLTMQQSNPGIPDSISEWKGQNIIDFQNDIRFKQNEYISEKWFYTHMKSENAKLPRIDILNFLSKYAGYKNWEDFVQQNSLSASKKKSDKSNRVLYVVPLITVVILSIFYFTYKSYYSQEFTFCFYDNVSKQPIANSLIEITLLEHNQSDRNYLCDADGCFTLKTNKTKISFVVKTPYYRTDTIVRRLNSFNRHETIKLRIDDYAVMIQYFSNSNVKDWMKRKKNLDLMFSDNAKIYQVLSSTVGMEIYNKWEFINKLTLPTSGLRDIEILDSRYEDDKITHLCFRQNGKE